MVKSDLLQCEYQNALKTLTANKTKGNTVSAGLSVLLPVFKYKI